MQTETENQGEADGARVKGGSGEYRSGENLAVGGGSRQSKGAPEAKSEQEGEGSFAEDGGAEKKHLGACGKQGDEFQKEQVGREIRGNAPDEAEQSGEENRVFRLWQSSRQAFNQVAVALGERARGDEVDESS